MKISKTAILPVISVLFLAIGAVTGHVVSADTQDLIATYASVIITAAVSVWGIYQNHQKDGEQK